MFKGFKSIFSNKDKSGLRVGQVFKYKTRPGEENSTVMVIKIKDNTIHIKINDVVINGKKNGIDHSPITREAFVKSITSLKDVSEGKIDLTGYESWKQQQGGAFNISIAQIVDLINEAVSKK